MTERIAFGAIALLLAANVLTRTGSPEFVALVGTYVAVAAAGDVPTRYVLTLAADGTATLVTQSPGDARASAPETGSWIVDGPSVQVALTRSAGDGLAEGFTLHVSDGALVGASSDEPDTKYAGLSFVRSSVGASPAGTN